MTLERVIQRNETIRNSSFAHRDCRRGGALVVWGLGAAAVAAVAGGFPLGAVVFGGRARAQDAGAVGGGEADPASVDEDAARGRPSEAAHEDQGVAGPGRDRVSLGEDVHVARGEVVRNLVTLGGDVRIEGRVLGDVLTMGGDAHIVGQVLGDVWTLGGDVQVDGAVGGEVVTTGGTLRLGPNGRVDGGVTTPGDGGVTHGDGPAVGTVMAWLGLGTAIGSVCALASWVGTALSGLVSFVLLFSFGLLLQSLMRDRMTALHVVIVRDPVRAWATGALAGLSAVVATLVLTLTIVGIPVAVLLALALCAAIYIGLTAVAAVTGALMPTDRLRDKPALQLLVGVALLYAASLVPGVGTFVLFVAGLLGLGAVVLTRLRETPPVMPTTESGPYRTARTAG
jgi:hypothetical protein